MKEILVSIIVPVYNSSKYLDKCVKYLVNQSYQNIEIIFVNDGSTDNSLDILNKYKADKRIKILNQKNMGANLARVNGLKRSNGDYIMFIDSDDYILPNTVFDLVSIINENSPDIIKYKFINFDTGSIENKDYTNKEGLLKQLLTTTKLNNITNEIISKNVVILSDDVFQVKSSNAEDLLMNLSFFDHAKSIKVIDNKYYYYTENENSTTKTMNIERILSSIKDFDRLLEILLNYAKKWNLNSDSIIDKLYYRNIIGICSQVIKIIDFKCDNETIININHVLDNAIIYNYDYKRIIYNNEEHLINKMIYVNILKRRYKVAKILLAIKKTIKKVIH